jgi:hypothetical protein
LRLYYRPWKGRFYDQGYHNKLKLLILGHLHYDDGSRTATVDWTRQHLIKPDRFWTHVEQVVTGHPLTANERTEFWERVAFANFIQDMLQKNGCPTKDQWLRARHAFRSLILETTPDLVFVFSQTVWINLPEDDDDCGFRGYQPMMSGRAGLYQVSRDYRFVAGVFNHPRRPGRKRKYWASRLLLEASRTL